MGVKFRGICMQAILPFFSLGAATGNEPAPTVVLDPLTVAGSRLPALPGGWESGVSTRFIDGYASNSTGAFRDQATAIGSWTTVDLRVGYRFSRGLWRGLGKDLRVLAGVGNVADRDPPYADTVYGYNPGLLNPLGRN